MKKICPVADDRTLARGMALTTAWLRDSAFQSKFADGIARFKMTSSEQAFMSSIYAGRIAGRKLFWSNRAVRRASTEALIDAFLDDLEADPTRKRWLATFAWDDGITTEADPEVDIVSLKGKVDKALRLYGLEGLGIVEVDSTTFIVGHGKLLLFHVHVYCWAKEGVVFNAAAAGRELISSRRFPNRLGARSVDFQPVTEHDISVARIAGYLTKYQPGAKNRIGRRSKPGKFSLRSTIRGFTPDSVVRLVEVMSHFDARDVVFSIGPSGRELRQLWYTRFMAWARKPALRRRRRPDANYDVTMLWRDIRRQNASKKMKPCRIVIRTSQRVCERATQ